VIPPEGAGPDGHARWRPPPWRALDAALLLGLCGLALAARLVGLTRLTLIDDELAHLYFVQREWEFLYDALFFSPHLPVWFALYKGWVALSQGDLWLRAFSLLWGVLAVAATYGAAREVRGRAGGALAAGLLGISGFHINFSQTVTPYALIALLGAASLWTTLATLRRGTRGAAALHVLALTAACYTHQSGLLLWGALLTGALVLRAGAGRDPGALRLRTFAWAHGGVLVACAGLVPILRAQWRTIQQLEGVSYVAPVTPVTVADRVQQLLGYGWGHGLAPPALTVLAGGVLAVAVVLVRPDPRGGLARLPAALAAVWSSPLLLCTALAVLVRKELLYEARFFAALAPVWAALVAVVVLDLCAGGSPRRRARLALGQGVLVLAVLSQVGSWAMLYGGTRQQENFPIRAISRHLEQRAAPGDIAVVHSSYYLFFFKRYYRFPHPRFIGAVGEGFARRPFGGLHDRPDEASLARLRLRLRGHERVWLVLTPTTNRLLRDPDGLVSWALEARYRRVDDRCFACGSDDPVHLLLLVPRRGSGG